MSEDGHRNKRKLDCMTALEDMAFVKQQLLATLADLVDEDLRTFQFYLYSNEVEGFERIPKYRAFGLDRERTVDLTVQTYGYKQAVTVAVGILRKMGFNLFADELEEKCKEVTSSKEVKESENNATQEGADSTSKEKFLIMYKENTKEGDIIYLKHIYKELQVTDGAKKVFIKEHEVIQQTEKPVAAEKSPEEAAGTFKANPSSEKQGINVAVQGIPTGETIC